MQDLSRSELEAIFKVIDPSALPKKEESKEPSPTPEEKNIRSASASRIQLTQLHESSSDTPLFAKELMRNVNLRLDIILGRSTITLAQLLELRSGTALSLDKLAGEPADIELNGQIIGKGEVVVIEDNFGIHITHLSIPK